MSSFSVNVKQFPQPLDRIALGLMLVLSLLIGLLLWNGDHTAPRVRSFSWQDKQVGAEDIAFTMTFNRPMDWASVESNLQIEPPLPGKISWSGRRLAYTLTQPIPYGTAFQVKLAGAEDSLGQQAKRTRMQPFLEHFRSRDHAIVYLGVDGDEAGRLILNNLTQQKKTVLTPPNLVVAEFKPYTAGDRILFSATQRAVQAQGTFDPKLYTVSTGIQANSPDAQPAKREPVGRVKLILDNIDYQILKFDLSPDGQRIVVQRAKRQNLAQTSLWVFKQNESPQLVNSQAGGDFLVTPDSNAIVIAEGQGLAVVPLAPQGSSHPLDFLPQFGMVLSFAKDGSAATMVKFNTDYTRSLFLVTNQGTQKELLRTTGSILSTQFAPLKQTLYCLLTRLLPGKDYNEQLYIATIDLQTSKLMTLINLPGQRDVQMSLAPDGSALVFDQAISTNQPEAKTLQTDQGQAIATSNVWLLPLQPQPHPKDASPQTQRQLEAVSTGFHPRWLP